MTFSEMINPNFMVKIAFSTGSFILFLTIRSVLECGKINAVFAHSKSQLNGLYLDGSLNCLISFRKSSVSFLCPINQIYFGLFDFSIFHILIGNL